MTPSLPLAGWMAGFFSDDAILGTAFQGEKKVMSPNG
jgi:hypothetical protein